MTARNTAMEIFTPAARAAIVEEMFHAGVIIPENMLSTAFKVLNEGMTAVAIEYFAYKGRVRDQRAAPDHRIRIGAAKEVLTLAQLLTKDKEAPTDDPTVAMEFDSNTGVLRLVVGNNRSDRAAVRVSTVQQVNAREPEVPPSSGKVALPGKLLNDLLIGDLRKKRIVHDEIVE